MCDHIPSVFVYLCDQPNTNFNFDLYAGMISFKIFKAIFTKKEHTDVLDHVMVSQPSR